MDCRDLANRLTIIADFSTQALVLEPQQRADLHQVVTQQRLSTIKPKTSNKQSTRLSVRFATVEKDTIANEIVNENFYLAKVIIPPFVKLVKLLCC